MTAEELRSKVGVALACVDRGEIVTITCRGKPKAQLVGVDLDQERPTAGEGERMPAFGMWRDRDDIADVPAHVRRLRKGRFGRKAAATRP